MKRFSRKRVKGVLLELDDWTERHFTPDSRVWAVTPPCGYGFWSLFAPGSRRDADGFYRDEPFAEHPIHRKDDWGADGLPEIRAWLLPWIETQAGAPVTRVVEGWCAPYGPDRQLREYVIYVEVSG